MNLYIAMSCLQGKADKEALEELVPLAKELGCAGIQLTPGNAPALKGDMSILGSLKSRLHHTYSDKVPVGKGWSRENDKLVFGTSTAGRSIHPPFKREASLEETCEFFQNSDMLCELPLYKDYLGASYSDCMALYEAAKSGVAIDVSHLNISFNSEGWSKRQVQELLNLSNIREIHISANNGRRDQHRALLPNDFGLDWARERSKDGIPVVLECYMHLLSEEDRYKQVELALGL